MDEVSNYKAHQNVGMKDEQDKNNLVSSTDVSWETIDIFTTHKSDEVHI